MTGETVMSKGEFAALCNVKPSRLSHWIAEGRISGLAIIGEGRTARIRVEEAQRQLRRNLDPSQMTGNGAATNLRSVEQQRTPVPTSPPPPPAPVSAAPPPGVDLAYVAWEMVREIPGAVAWCVVAEGGTMQQAFNAFHDTCGMAAYEVRRKLDAELPGPFDPVNWTGLAEEYGHVADVPAMERERERREAVRNN